MQTCYLLTKGLGVGSKILASENPELQEAVSSVVHDHQPGLLLSGVRHWFHHTKLYTGIHTTACACQTATKLPY